MSKYFSKLHLIFAIVQLGFLIYENDIEKILKIILDFLGLEDLIQNIDL